MKRTILALVLISTPAAAQQWPVPGFSTPQPVQPTVPPIVPPGQNGVIYTPDGMITRNGPYVQYPDGATAIINNGLTTWSNGQGCRTTGATTYCW